MQIDYTMQVWRVDGQFIAHAMPLDEASSGPTAEAARKAVDESVRLFLATADQIWLPWSEKQFRSAAAQGPIVQRENTSVESTKPGRAMNADYDLKDPFQSLALKLRLRSTLAEVLARTSAKP